MGLSIRAGLGCCAVLQIVVKGRGGLGGTCLYAVSIARLKYRLIPSLLSTTIFWGDFELASSIWFGGVAINGLLQEEKFVSFNMGDL